MSELSYEDFKNRLTIQDVLLDAGYHFNRRDGLRYPSYVRLDSDGRRIRGDKFIVSGNGTCCFQPPVMKNYNIISFIKEHPDLFTDYKPGMDPDRLVNLVCNRLLNHPIEDREKKIFEPLKNAKPFRLNSYDVFSFNPKQWETQKKFYPYFVHRGIDLFTQNAFREHFFLATKHNADKLPYTNLAFPLRIPGQDTIVGLEERGRLSKLGKSYKGMAEGTNAAEGLWIANLTGKPLKDVKDVLWFESAYDAMAEFQINPVKSVYVSTGGTPSQRQIRGMLETAPNANHYLGFDKDLAGKQFVENFKSIAKDMGFGFGQVQSYHPLGQFKDWNDALLDKRDPRLVEAGEKDYDYQVQLEENKAQRNNQSQHNTYHR